MAESLHLPPKTAERAPVDYWLAQYDTPVPPTTRTPAAGNYPGWLGRMMAGFMQARPPTVELSSGEMVEDDQRDDVLDVLDEAAEKSAALSVSYLRPVNTGDEWQTQVIDPANVHATWTHRRLAAAIVWRLVADPSKPDDQRSRLAIVERWGINRDGQQIDTPTVEFWLGDITPEGRFHGQKLLDNDDLPANVAAMPAVQGALEDAADDRPREIVPVPWRFHRGMPVPIYHRQEKFVEGLCRLVNQEQVDAEKVKKRVAVDRRMIGTSALRSDRDEVIANAGWHDNQDVFLLDGTDAGAQNLAERLPFHVVDFDDDLVQNERINARENQLLEQCGISPQSVGRSVSGRSDSAAAKRADQQLTMTTISNPARLLSSALSRAFTQTAQLNGNDVTVTVTVNEGLRPVRQEQIDEAATIAQNDMGSAETILRVLWPERDDEWIEAEANQMASENRMVAPLEGIVPTDLSTLPV